MNKLNIKESLLEVVISNNLDILKIDLKSAPEYSCKAFGGDIIEVHKSFNTIKDLDFEVESALMHDEVLGTVYCRDKDTKEPVWIVSRGDEGGSWWEVNRVPEFYKNQFKNQRMKNSYKIKHIFIGSKEYKMPNGFLIRVKITVKEINKV